MASPTTNFFLTPQHKSFTIDLTQKVVTPLAAGEDAANHPNSEESTTTQYLCTDMVTGENFLFSYGVFADLTLMQKTGTFFTAHKIPVVKGVLKYSDLKAWNDALPAS